MSPQYIYFIIFACLAYLIVTDNSVAKLVVLVSHLIKFQFQKYIWIIRHHPRTPWAQYFMHRRSMKLAKELLNEIEMERQSRESNNDSKTAE